MTLSKRQREEYLKVKEIIGKYFIKHGKMPSKANLLTMLKNVNPTYNMYRMTQYMKLMVKQELLILDFNRWDLTDNWKEKLNEIGERGLEIRENRKQKNKKQKDRWVNIDFNIVNIVRYVMLFVGIGASRMSIYYTKLFLEKYLTDGLSFLLSFTMVLFTVFVFETLILLWKRKKYWCIFLILPWIVVLFFSMTSTIAGQYNNRSITIQGEKTQNIEIQHKNIKYNILIEEKKELEKLLKISNNEVIQKQKIVDGFTTEDRKEEWQQYFNSENKLKDSKKYRDSIREKLEIKNKEIVKYLEQNKNAGAINQTKNQREDFFVWVSKILKIDADMLEFWLSVFPALFIDIIAPIAFALFLFLKKDK